MQSSSLSIGYSGIFLSTCFKKKYEKTGVILTRSGKIFVRDTKYDDWDMVETPLIFLFRDKMTSFTYLVDKNKKSITEIDPFGRVLDCTERIIYEVQDCKWSPVYDLSVKTGNTIVRCSHISNCQSPFSFDVIGYNPKILSDFSEIDFNLVDLANGFLNIDAVASGKCAVLVYQTYIYNNTAIVAHLFIREKMTARFSVKCGQFIPHDAPMISVIPSPHSLCPDDDLCLAPILSIDGIATNLYQLQDWITIYQVPNGQFSSDGVWTVPQSGDYDIKAEIHLSSSYSFDVHEVSNGQLPHFILVRYKNGNRSGTIELSAPIEMNISFLDSKENRFESAHASIVVALRLNKEDTIVIYYVDTTGTMKTLPHLNSSSRGYRTIRCATTFNACYLGGSV